jgi:hypothetical protein
MTGKQRMLNAYRGLWNDRVAISPEFWCYYPAKILGVDMIEFEREVPFHLAMKTTFEHFNCEGWGIAIPSIPNERIESRKQETWTSESTLKVRTITRTPAGDLTGTQRFDRDEPSWVTERPIKDFERDLQAYEIMTMADPAQMDVSPLMSAWRDVGESYLLEAWLGDPFFDYFATAREGGLERAIFDFAEHESQLRALQEKYISFMTRKASIICEKTPIESLCITCAWSCNSLEGPTMWREWDKPVIRAVADTVHRHGRLLHVHFHGRCMESVADFAEMGIDCVCPFERPPGGDVDGLKGLRRVAELLAGRTTFLGNIQTVETLIRGTPEDVRREVREVLTAFHDNPRVIVGTGDQVGRETPEENLHAMIEEAALISRRSNG